MNTHQMPALLRFACDSIPNCEGQIVACIGDFVILEGMAADSGAWFTKGPGGPRKHNSRQEAADYIEYAQPMAQDAKFKTDDQVETPDGQGYVLDDFGGEYEVQLTSGRSKTYKEAQLKSVRGARDEPIAADLEEVKKAWREASAVAQKRHPDYKSGNYESRAGDSDDAEDCEGMDAGQFTTLRGEVEDLTEASVKAALKDGKISKERAQRLLSDLAAKGAKDASDPKDVLHQIEGSYRNMDAPTIASERKKVIALMDNAANPPAIRDAAKNLLLRMNREEDKMHGDGAMDDLAKQVTEKKLRQMLKDGEWEVDVDIAPAIQNRRAIEVRTQTGKKFWVRVE